MHHSEVQSVLVQQMLLDEMQGRCRKCQANARGAASKFTALGTVQPLQEVKVEFGCLVGRVGGGGIGEMARQVQTLARELGTEAWLGGRCKERQGEARVSRLDDQSASDKRARKSVARRSLEPSNPGARAAATAAKASWLALARRQSGPRTLPPLSQHLVSAVSTVSILSSRASPSAHVGPAGNCCLLRRAGGWLRPAICDAVLHAEVRPSIQLPRPTTTAFLQATTAHAGYLQDSKAL